MEPEPSISGEAYFSTHGGKWAPEPVPVVRSHVIVRGDLADIDADDQFLARLRREFPEKCKSILKPLEHAHDIYEYFDGKDVSIHGLGYLRSLLDRIAWDNLHRIQKLERFVQNWIDNNENLFWSLTGRLTIQEVFNQKDIDEYGKEWLEDSLERIWRRRDREAANVHATHAQLPDRGNFHSDPEQWIRDQVNADQMRNVPNATPKTFVSSVWLGNPSSQIQSHRVIPLSDRSDRYPGPPPQSRPRRLPVPMPVSNDARVLERLEARSTHDKVEAQMAFENQLNLASGNVNLGLPVIPESSRSPFQEGYQSQELPQTGQHLDQLGSHTFLAPEQSPNPRHSSSGSAGSLIPATGVSMTYRQHELLVPRVRPPHASPLARDPALTPLETPTLSQAYGPLNTRQYPMPYPSYYGPQPQPPQSPNYPLPSDGPLSRYQRRQSSGGQPQLGSQGMSKKHRRGSSASGESGYISRQGDNIRRNSTGQSALEMNRLWVGDLLETDSIETLYAFFRDWEPTHISDFTVRSSRVSQQSPRYTFITFTTTDQAAAALANVNREKVAILGRRALSVRYAYRRKYGQDASSFHDHPSHNQHLNNSNNGPTISGATPLPYGPQASVESFNSHQRSHANLKTPPDGADGPSYVGNGGLNEHVGNRWNQPPVYEATPLPHRPQPATQFSEVSREDRVSLPKSTREASAASLESLSLSPTDLEHHPLEAAVPSHEDEGSVDQANSPKFDERALQSSLPGTNTAANQRSLPPEASGALYEHRDHTEELSKAHLSRQSESSPAPNEQGVTGHDFASQPSKSTAQHSYVLQDEYDQRDALVLESCPESMIGSSKATDLRDVEAGIPQTPASKPERISTLKETEEALDSGPKASAKGGKGPKGNKNKAKALVTAEGPAQKSKQPSAVDMAKQSGTSVANGLTENRQSKKRWNPPRKDKFQQHSKSNTQQANTLVIASANATSGPSPQRYLAEASGEQAIDKLSADMPASQEMTRGDSSSSQDAVKTPAHGVLSTQPTTYAPSEVSEADIPANQEQRVIVAGSHQQQKEQTREEPKSNSSSHIDNAVKAVGQSADIRAKADHQQPKQSPKKSLLGFTPAVPDFDKLRQLHRDEKRLQQLQQRLEDVATDETTHSVSAETDNLQNSTRLLTSEKPSDSLAAEETKQLTAHDEPQSVDKLLSPQPKFVNIPVEERAPGLIADTVHNESGEDQTDSAKTLSGSTEEEAWLTDSVKPKQSKSQVSSNGDKLEPPPFMQAEASLKESKGKSEAEAVLDQVPDLVPMAFQGLEPGVAPRVDSETPHIRTEVASLEPIMTHKKKQKGREVTQSQDHLSPSEANANPDIDLGASTGDKESTELSQESSSMDLEAQAQSSQDVAQEQPGSVAFPELDKQLGLGSVAAGVPKGPARKKKSKRKSKKKKLKPTEVNTPEEDSPGSGGAVNEPVIDVTELHKNLPPPERPYSFGLNEGNLRAPQTVPQTRSDDLSAHQARLHGQKRKLETIQEQINPHFSSFSSAADDYYKQKNAAYLPFLPAAMNSAQPVGNDNEDPDPQGKKSSSKLSPASRARDAEQAMKDCGYILEEEIDEEAVEGDDEMSQDDSTEEKDNSQPEGMFNTNQLTAIAFMYRETRSAMTKDQGGHERSVILNELPADIVEGYIEGSLTIHSARLKFLDEDVKTKLRRLAKLDQRAEYLKRLKENDDRSNALESVSDTDLSEKSDQETTDRATETPATGPKALGVEGGASSGTRSGTTSQKENQRPTADRPSVESKRSSDINTAQVYARIKHGDGTEELIPIVEEEVWPTTAARDWISGTLLPPFLAPKWKNPSEKAAEEIWVSATRSGANFVKQGVIYTRVSDTDSKYKADYEFKQDDEAHLNTKDHCFEFVTRNGATVWKREGFDEKASPSKSTSKITMTQLAFAEVQPLELGPIVEVKEEEISALQKQLLAAPATEPMPNYFRNGVIYTKVPETANKYTVAYKLHQGDELVLNCTDKSFDYVIRNRDVVWVRLGLTTTKQQLTQRRLFNPWNLPQSQAFDVGAIVEVKQKDGQRKKVLRERPFIERKPPPLESYLPEYLRGRSNGRRLGDQLWGVPRGEPAWGSGE